jgi:hypothetical protein
MKSIQLHPSMGEAIVHHLRQFGDIPNRGILAGQAVDSAITDLFGNGGGVYNDIDIFRNVPGGYRKGYQHWASGTAQRSNVDMVRVRHYEGMALVMDLVATYAIKSVSRQGMLNFVNCHMLSGHLNERLTASAVIASFDLNCTRVAIDLATNTLVWDRHYEEFLRSRQLQIAVLHTPWHTFLRLAKKAEELPNVFVNYEAAAQACVALGNSESLGQLVTGREVSLAFGQKHMELAERTRDRWEPYFTLEDHTKYRGKYSWHDAKDSTLDPGEILQVAKLWRMTPRGALDAAVQARCDKLGSGILLFAPKVIEEVRRVKAPAAVAKLDAVVAHRRKTATQPDLDFVLRYAELFGTDYVQGQALPSVADKVADWLEKHRGFTKHVTGMSLAQQYALVQTTTEIAREFGNTHLAGDTQAALGIMEVEAKAPDFESKERMLAVLTRAYQRDHQVFEIEALPLPTNIPQKFAEFSVEELLNTTALRKEGREMHHCVGGYAHAVKSGRSRILSIRYKGKRIAPHCSTVELRGNFFEPDQKKAELWVAQNYTFGNKPTSLENQEFVEFLLDYLEAQRLVRTSMLRHPERLKTALTQWTAQPRASLMRVLSRTKPSTKRASKTPALALRYLARAAEILPEQRPD